MHLKSHLQHTLRRNSWLPAINHLRQEWILKPRKTLTWYNRKNSVRRQEVVSLWENRNFTRLEKDVWLLPWMWFSRYLPRWVVTLERCLTINRKSCCRYKDRASHGLLLCVLSVQWSLGRGHWKSESENQMSLSIPGFTPTRASSRKILPWKNKSRKSEWGYARREPFRLCSTSFLCKVASVWQRLALLRGLQSVPSVAWVSLNTRDSRLTKSEGISEVAQVLLGDRLPSHSSKPRRRKKTELSKVDHAFTEEVW